MVLGAWHCSEMSEATKNMKIRTKLDGKLKRGSK